MPGNRLDRWTKPGEGRYSRCAFCRVHRVLRTPLDICSDGTLRRDCCDEAPSGTPLVSRLVGTSIRHRRDEAPPARRWLAGGMDLLIDIVETRPPAPSKTACLRSADKGTAPILSADGNTLLTEKSQILQRWTEHFRGVLNRPSTISDAGIVRLPQVETNVDLDLPPAL
ncbi:hypothetical protein SprV_1002900400 [Sparganum proliferum]